MTESSVSPTTDGYPQDDGQPSAQPEPAGASNFYVIVFAVFMIVGLVSLAWIGRPPRSTAIGQKLPRLDLSPLVNAEQAIDADSLSGKFVVLHFWGTWCGYCVQEFPEFVELSQEFSGSDDVAVVSISCSSGPEYDLDQLGEQTRQFINDYAPQMPTYADSAGMTRQQLALLLPNGSFGYPTTILVGPDGVIQESIEGYRSGDMESIAAMIRANR